MNLSPIMLLPLFGVSACQSMDAIYEPEVTPFVLSIVDQHVPARAKGYEQALTEATIHTSHCHSLLVGNEMITLTNPVDQDHQACIDHVFASAQWAFEPQTYGYDLVRHMLPHPGYSRQFLRAEQQGGLFELHYQTSKPTNPNAAYPTVVVDYVELFRFKLNAEAMQIAN